MEKRGQEITDTKQEMRENELEDVRNKIKNIRDVRNEIRNR